MEVGRPPEVEEEGSQASFRFDVSDAVMGGGDLSRLGVPPSRGGREDLDAPRDAGGIHVAGWRED